MKDIIKWCNKYRFDYDLEFDDLIVIETPYFKIKVTFQNVYNYDLTKIIREIYSVSFWKKRSLLKQFNFYSDDTKKKELINLLDYSIKTLMFQKVINWKVKVSVIRLC